MADDSVDFLDVLHAQLDDAPGTWCLDTDKDFLSNLDLDDLDSLIAGLEHLRDRLWEQTERKVA